MFSHGFNSGCGETGWQSIDENIAIVRKQRERIGELIDYIKSCTTEEGSQKNILFVIPEKPALYEERLQPDKLNTFSVPADEAAERISVPGWEENRGYALYHSWDRVLDGRGGY